LTRSEAGFELATSNGTFSAAKMIVTTGGQSYPGSGTTGDGYRWMAALGHTIVPPRPALTPITTSAAWIAPLRGVTILNAELRVVVAESETCLAQSRGSLLFTHFGVSGPAVLNLSRTVSGHAHPSTLALECDFLPAMRNDAFDEQLRIAFAENGKKQIESIVALWLPRRLAETIVDRCDLAGGVAAEVSRQGRRRLAHAIKGMRIPISGTRGFKKAEVTSGGVSLDEVDSRTMQSKLVPDLFLAGEILDLDGPIGGYNFQAAFSTGWLAGGSV
jgi:predicted Rossmann fold flavoprotein